MSTFKFSDGVIFAFVAAVSASLLLTLLPGWLGTRDALRLTIALLTLVYIGYLLRKSPERTGRVVTMSAAVLVAAGSLWAIQPIGWFLLTHIVLSWLVRSLYHLPGPLAAVLDLGLHLLATAAGLWAFIHADSPFLAIWSFFLTQALFVVIPAAERGRRRQREPGQPPADAFDVAHRHAEAAVRTLSTQ